MIESSPPLLTLQMSRIIFIILIFFRKKRVAKRVIQFSADQRQLGLKRKCWQIVRKRENLRFLLQWKYSKCEIVEQFEIKFCMRTCEYFEKQNINFSVSAELQFGEMKQNSVSNIPQMPPPLPPFSFYFIWQFSLKCENIQCQSRLSRHIILQQWDF